MSLTEMERRHDAIYAGDLDAIREWAGDDHVRHTDTARQAFACLFTALDGVTAERDALRGALLEIADLAPKCHHCEDLGPVPSPPRRVTHQTTFGLGELTRRVPIYLCAEHAPDRAASHHKAESKGSGKQPEVVAYVEENEAIVIAANALAALEAP